MHKNIHILVLAQTIDLDKTSEGIVTCKFIKMLSHKYKVTCVAMGIYPEYNRHTLRVPWLDEVDVYFANDQDSISITYWKTLNQSINQLMKSSSTLRMLGGKIGAFISFVTGYSVVININISIWKSVLTTYLKKIEPDIVIIRGAGSDFSGSIAASRMKCSIPWIVNYHDPYPSSLYPVPYRSSVPIISRKQEKDHYHILKQARAIMFPSQQLQHWVLQDKQSVHLSKSYVIPHLSKLPEERLESSITIPAYQLTFMHIGTLLGPRDPSSLLEAYNTFLLQDSNRRKNTKLYFIGSINRTHSQVIEKYAKYMDDNLIVCPWRVHYIESITLAHGAGVLILLEHNATHSPFLPAKVTDYLALSKPILAITSTNSATRELLGKDYALISDPNAESIFNNLEKCWFAWLENSLSKLIPPDDARRQVSESVILDMIEQMFEDILGDNEN
jgi:hypothetical protein